MADGTLDDAKGRVKEAAGSLTGDKELKDEGRIDQAKSTVKDIVRAARAGSRSLSAAWVTSTGAPTSSSMKARRSAG